MYLIIIQLFIHLLQDAVHGDSSYMSTLTRSMGLVLDEFYSNLRVSNN